MNVIEYIENDGACAIGYLVRDMVLQEEVVHPKYGEVIVNEKNGNDIDVVIDGNPMTVRINGYDDKQEVFVHQPDAHRPEYEARDLLLHRQEDAGRGKND